MPFAPRRACSTCRSRRSLELLADVKADAAAKAAAGLGFARSTGDWRELVADPAVDLVDITAPNTLHLPIALAAIEAGKPVYCEKPLAPNALEAKRMVDAAERKGDQDRRRLQLPQEPDGGARPRDRRKRRDRRGGELPRHPRRGLHDRSARRRSPGASTRPAATASSPISAATSSPSPGSSSGRSSSLVGQIETVTHARARVARLARDARRRGRRRGAGAGPLRQRRHRLARGELGQGRAEDDARLRGDRIEGHRRGRPRAAATSCGSTPPASRSGREGFKTILAGPRPRVLQGVLPGAGPPARLQRHQDHRGDGAHEVARPAGRNSCPTSARPGRSSAWSTRSCSRPTRGAGSR